MSPRSDLELSSDQFQFLNYCSRNVACFCSPPLPCSVVISEEESYKLYYKDFLLTGSQLNLSDKKHRLETGRSGPRKSTLALT